MDSLELTYCVRLITRLVVLLLVLRGVGHRLRGRDYHRHRGRGLVPEKAELLLWD